MYLYYIVGTLKTITVNIIKHDSKIIPSVIALCILYESVYSVILLVVAHNCVMCSATSYELHCINETRINIDYRSRELNYKQRPN